MIEEEFIPYQEALALKELEFNEECMAWYGDNGNIMIYGKDPEYDFSISLTLDTHILACKAPTWRQIFKWFRDKHDLYAVVWCYHKQGFYIETKSGGSIAVLYTTYEEGELACLRKLIEIAKNKKLASLEQEKV